jgi:hypothetical protein
LEVKQDFLERLEAERLWDGSSLPSGLQFRLQREYERIEFIRGQVQQLEAQRRLLLKESESRDVDQVRALSRLKGIGVNSAWLYVTAHGCT